MVAYRYYHTGMFDLHPKITVTTTLKDVIATNGTSTERGRPHCSADTTLREHFRILAQQRPRFGYCRLAVLLRRAGHVVNYKWSYRFYPLEGLAVRRQRQKRIAAAQRPMLAAP